MRQGIRGGRTGEKNAIQDGCHSDTKNASYKMYEAFRTSPGRESATLNVHVVADYATEDRTGHAADDCTLHFVAARGRADHGTSCGANRGVTLGVLHDRLPTRCGGWRWRRVRAR